MAIKDYFGDFFDAQAIASGTLAGNILNFGTGKNEWGSTINLSPDQANNDLFLNVRITEKVSTVSGGSAAYLQFQLFHGATSACSYLAVESPKLSFGVASLDAGDLAWGIGLPRDLKPYVQLKCVSSQVKDGAFDAWIGADTERTH